MRVELAVIYGTLFSFYSRLCLTTGTVFIK